MRLMILGLAASTFFFSLHGCRCGKAGKAGTSFLSPDSASDTSSSLSSLPSVPVCRYRNAVAEGLPYNYYLWQGERACQEGSHVSCTPEPPPIFTTRREIVTYDSQSVRPPFLSRLPADEIEIMAFLEHSDQFGNITWVDDSNSEIYDLLQEKIDSASPEQDIHFVVGFAHAVVGQTEFFNELLSEGADGRIVSGVTHLALEISRTTSSGVDAQVYLDQYLIWGDESFMPQLVSRKWRLAIPGERRELDIPIEKEEEIQARLHTLKLGYEKCYNVVFADIPRRDSANLKEWLGEYYWLSAREIYAVERVLQRQDPVGRDVVFWSWGANHVEKHRLPFYIKNRAPEAKVISIIINGGTYVSALAFDRALKHLGWLEKTFILRLDGYREADYVIHVPTMGRERLWGISRRGNPVLQHILDPPH